MKTLTTLIAWLAVWLAAPAQSVAQNPPAVPREVVVRLGPGVSAAQFAQERGSAVLGSIVSRNAHRLSVPIGLGTDDFLSSIQDDSGVVFAELNFIAADTNPGADTRSIFVASTLGEFLEQPALDSVGADGAQVVALGGGVIVAVIDSGIDVSHPFFARRVLLAPLDLIEPGGAAFDGPDGLDNDGDGLIDEAVGHGTIVAGIVGLMAPEAVIMPIRVLDSDGASTTFRLSAAVFAATDAGADVLNISLGTIAESQLLSEAIDEALAAEAVVIASAGNEGTDQAPSFPAAFSARGVLSVAATRATDVVAPFSNFGSTVTLTAPGDPVVGTAPGGQFGSAQGTSFAAPLVSGAVALLRSVAPGVPSRVIRDRLLATAVNIDATNPQLAGNIGAGRVSASAALSGAGAGLLGFADLNNDRRVNTLDLYILQSAGADIDGDGAFTSSDRAAMERFVRRFEVLGMKH
ncbi:MAG: hypothetical protein C0513_06910 [Isosphaera sp.]|nr:hypothetical protein [Isosphaera sp.]